MDVFCVILFAASILWAIFHSILVGSLFFLAACLMLAAHLIRKELADMYIRREYLWKQQERHLESIQKEIAAIKKELKKQ